MRRAAAKLEIVFLFLKLLAAVARFAVSMFYLYARLRVRAFVESAKFKRECSRYVSGAALNRLHRVYKREVAELLSLGSLRKLMFFLQVFPDFRGDPSRSLKLVLKAFPSSRRAGETVDPHRDPLGGRGRV